MDVIATDIPKRKTILCKSHNTHANNNLLKPYICTNTYKPLNFWRKSASQEHINRLRYINIWLTILKQRTAAMSDTAILHLQTNKQAPSNEADYIAVSPLKSTKIMRTKLTNSVSRL